MGLQLRWLAGSRRGLMDGVVKSAYFDQPTCVSNAPGGDIWIVDHGNIRIRKMADQTVVTSLTGARGAPYQVATTLSPVSNGQPIADPFNYPITLCHGDKGVSYVADRAGRLRKMVGGSIYTVAASDVKKYLEGWVVVLSNLSSVRMDHLGGLWVASTGTHRIIHLFSGGHKDYGYSENGRSLAEPNDVAFLPQFSRHVFVADLNQILLLEREHSLMEVYAGTDAKGYKDGFRTIAEFGSCDRLLACPNGDLLVSDIANHAIRKISVTGMVTTFVGGTANSPIHGVPTGLTFPPLAPDNSVRRVSNLPPIIDGKLESPESCCFNDAGDLIIPDSKQHLILAVDMAHVPANKRLNLGYCLTEDLSRLNLEFQTIRHKSGTSWNIFASTIALASESLLQPHEIIPYLEESDVPFESIECLLELMTGTVPKAFDSSSSAFLLGLGTLKLLIHLELWDLLEIFKSYLVMWAQDMEPAARLEHVAHAEVAKNTAELSGDTPKIVEARIFFEVVRSVAKAFFVLGKTEDLSESPVWGLRPYYGSGFLREQLEKLYWTTIGGLEGGSRKLLPLEASELPKHLCPNLEIVTYDGVVKCHDWVLVGRWRFVKNMFLFAGNETNSRQVSLEDVGITAAALQYIIYFMYTDRVDLLDDQSLCLSILKWCHELHLANLDANSSPVPGAERLMQHITKPFTQPISLENAIPIYKAAIEGGSPEHEKRALDFIARRLKDMMDSDRRCAEMRTLDPQVLTSIMFSHFGRTWPE